ncbi:hypothetical protein [Novipirellula rosea]|uniref:Uncharacterized protein n=1 Tax=Novipirellula rosea TaxID=1031540 RepID=A0ABP8MCG6_9BACT
MDNEPEPLDDAGTLVDALLSEPEVLPRYDRDSLMESCREPELSSTLGSLLESLSDLLVDRDTEADSECDSESLVSDPLRLLADTSQLCDGELSERESESLFDSLCETLETEPIDSLADDSPPDDSLVDFDVELLSDSVLPELLE